MMSAIWIAHRNFTETRVMASFTLVIETATIVFLEKYLLEYIYKCILENKQPDQMNKFND